jgi:hypothetical protein
VRAEDHDPAHGNLIQPIYENGTLRGQFIHNVAVVNDLFSHKYWSTQRLDRQSDSLDRADHSRAKATWAKQKQGAGLPTSIIPPLGQIPHPSSFGLYSSPGADAQMAQ